MNNKKVFIGVIWLLGILWVSFFTYKEFNTNVLYWHANYIADFSDNKKISWVSENIFIARVIKNKWDYKSTEKWPQETIFDVEILYNIKWKIKENTEVIQIWWYDPIWNLHLPHWTQYLKAWDIYVLSTLWENPYHILSHENGSHLIASNKEIEEKIIQSPTQTLSSLSKNIIKESWIVKEFRKAYKDEVYYEENEEWKYKISTEKNAYKTLTKQEKKSFEALENGFVIKK